ncbi:outer membrane protein [Flavobacterium helocola]|uniref:Outer membrane beta-barrel protein n=1 Tax=Flavobacterium helocola TaxID=3139139 RepID=A0ABU9I523_9FLAO
MKIKFLVLTTLFSLNLFSQNSKLSVELNYPIPFDNNFIAENYKSIVDVGVKYRFINSKVINVGVAFNAGVLYFDNKSYFQDYKVTNYMLQPKIFGEFNIQKFQPFIGIGYTSMIFNYKGSNNGFDISNESDTQSGIDFNIGLKYKALKNVFIQIQYDYIVLNVGDEIPRTKYNTNVNLLKIGLGYQFN